MTDSRFADAVEAFRSEGREALGPRSALEGASDVGPAALLSRSQEIEEAAGQALDSGDGDVRELGAMQLVAGAALDVAAAVDLLEPPTRSALEADGPAVLRVERVADELGAILAAPPALGARWAAPPPAGGALEGSADPLPALGDAAAKAIDEISGDAATIAGHAIDGLLALPASALLGAFARAADKLFGPLYQQVSGAVRWAVGHIAKAVSKLLRVLGPLEEPARRWLERSLGGAGRDKLTGWAVDAALGTQHIRTDTGGLIAAAAPPGDPDRLGAARIEVTSLASRFGRHELVIRVLAKVLDKLRSLILGLAGWAAAALAGVYVLMLAYGVWVAGDFLDWERTSAEGRLDFVAGVRTTVRLAVLA